MTLPPLRMELDFMPSPVQDRPGLLIRDPYHFSDATLVIPPVLVECLALFDGGHTDLDLREYLVRRTGRLEVGEAQEHLIRTLSAAGFLQDGSFEALRAGRLQEFREAEKRVASQAGAAYPDEPGALSEELARCVREGAAAGSPSGAAIGLAAPHASPAGAWECYGAAYGTLDPGFRDRTCVILGTSHFGQPDRFGLTRKNFVTPLGETVCDVGVVDALAREAEPAVVMEDYCHAVEHSIEFQVVFLQQLFGPAVRIVPILCGSYARSIQDGGRPERDEGVRRFLAALGELNAREGGRLLWVLGIDMAHMGRRYGDAFPARAEAGLMQEVAERDRRRIERINQGDADGFWELIRENQDDLKWCGAAPVYTFLRAAPQARGELLRYGQWNIDEFSVVTFAGMAFR